MHCTKIQLTLQTLSTVFLRLIIYALLLTFLVPNQTCPNRSVVEDAFPVGLTSAKLFSVRYRIFRRSIFSKLISWHTYTHKSSICKTRLASTPYRVHIKLLLVGSDNTSLIVHCKLCNSYLYVIVFYLNMFPIVIESIKK